MKTVIEMAREAGFADGVAEIVGLASCVERFAELVRADEREKVAAWMMQRGYATGHGDTVEGLLKELEWQVAEREREACAKVVTDNAHMFATPQAAESLANAIRARGQA